MSDAPIVIGYDGSAAADHALREAAKLLAPRRALVLVVWEAGTPYEALESPTVAGVAPAPLDVRTAAEVEEQIYEGAKRLAERGTVAAREAGFDAGPLVVADEDTVANTLVRVAEEHDAAALVVGAHGRGRLGELLLGGTSHGVLRHATRPVLVVRQQRER